MCRVQAAEADALKNGHATAGLGGLVHTTPDSVVRGETGEGGWCENLFGGGGGEGRERSNVARHVMLGEVATV